MKDVSNSPPPIFYFFFSAPPPFANKAALLTPASEAAPAPQEQARQALAPVVRRVIGKVHFACLFVGAWSSPARRLLVP